MRQYKATCVCGLDVTYLAFNVVDADDMGKEHHDTFFRKEMCMETPKVVPASEASVPEKFGEDFLD